MGTQVTVSSRHDSSPSFTVATVAAAAVAVADGELALWVGDSVTSPLEAYVGLEHCLEALREAGWPNPVTIENSYAIYDTADQTLTVDNGAAPSFDSGETEVAILQGFDFINDGASNSAFVESMMESYLESAKAA